MAWSNAKYILKTKSPYVISNYLDINASWFFKTWFVDNEWAWIYTNDTGEPVRLHSLTFASCAAHSNGKYFDGSHSADHPSSTKGTLYADGGGCTYHLDIYVSDSTGNHEYRDPSWTGVTDPINQFNCYYRGYGNTSLYTNMTSFGSPTFFGPQTSYSTDDYGHLRYMHPTTIAVGDNGPSVQPGGTLFAHVRVEKTEWTSPNSMLVIKGSGDNFQGDVIPEPEDYVWVYTDKKIWEKKKKAFMFTADGWKEMELN